MSQQHPSRHYGASLISPLVHSARNSLWFLQPPRSIRLIRSSLDESVRLSSNLHTIDRLVPASMLLPLKELRGDCLYTPVARVISRKDCVTPAVMVGGSYVKERMAKVGDFPDVRKEAGGHNHSSAPHVLTGNSITDQCQYPNRLTF